MTDAVEVGSTNVYADLGYPDAEALQRKASLASHIAWTIKARHLTHEAAAELLGIDQADIVKIVRGQFRSTSEAKMLEWIAMLGHPRSITTACNAADVAAYSWICRSGARAVSRHLCMLKLRLPPHIDRAPDHDLA